MRTTTHYAGMDIHATNTLIQSINSQGAMVARQELPSRADALIGWARDYPYRPLHVILEQSLHARWVANTLAPWVDRLVVCDPTENALIHRGGPKNDRVDAHKLARLLRLGEYKEVWWQPIEGRHVLKVRMKIYLQQRKAKAAAIQRLVGFIRHVGVRLPKTKSRFSFRRADEWIEQISSAEHRDLAGCKLEFIRYHHGQARQVFAQIREHGEDYWEIAEFSKIPGIAQVGAHLFSGFIEDPHWFNRRSQLYKFCQLAVTGASSGGEPIGHKRLDKRGYGELKAMSQRAWLGAMNTKTDNEVKRYWRASCGRSNSRRNARLNTQRKIVNVMWSLWKNGQPYDPNLF